MQNKTEYGCALVVNTEDIHPEIVSQMTGINSTFVTIKGCPRIHRRTGIEIAGTSNIENNWILDSGKYYQTEWELEQAIVKIIDMINLYDSFHNVFLRFKNSKLLCYAYVQHYNISFILSPKLIESVLKLNIPIEFDLYSLE